ncbi:hypothetical protein [Streptomyces sp. AD55]|uniref:hypothetical protein n=1 Tax=Streptomyces sp. AD55 TaxID=3242895 RepID=UPI003528CCBF
MAWDSWEELKQEAAQRHGTHMQLDQLPPGETQAPSTSDVTGGLVSHKRAWNKAGGDIGDLRDNIEKVLHALQNGQKGLDGKTGCLSVGAQGEVYDSWAAYLKGADDRCGKIKEVFEQVGHDLLKTDEAVSSALATIDTHFADTPALGGQGSGR